VFFCNSGVEAVEGAAKMARKYHDENGQPQRYRIICCTDAFHGRTLTGIAASGSEKYRTGFEPMVEGFDHVAFNNTNELRQAITDETAAILVEPIQGEGGIRPGGLDYLRALRAIADEFGLLLIFDEIQCGMGRSGKLFAHEWAEAAPDIMTLAKGIGGGFPMGAVLTTGAVARAMTPGSHGTTFGGNPLAMAVGNAVLDVMLSEGFLPRVDAVARDLWDKLLALAERQPHAVEEVRGAGLMLGLKCKVPNGQMIEALREERLLAVPAGDNVVRLLPPLIIATAEVDEALARIERACQRFG
jgi:acetylornithine/N-succinyldiaminopimelate aminotransferase